MKNKGNTGTGDTLATYKASIAQLTNKQIEAEFTAQVEQKDVDRINAIVEATDPDKMWFAKRAFTKVARKGRVTRSALSRALLRAAAIDSVDMIDLLLALGANPHDGHEQALRMSIMMNSTEALQRLLELGADLKVAKLHETNARTVAYIEALELQQTDGWQVISENVVSHTECGDPNAPRLTTMFNFSSEQVLTTVSLPDKDKPSEPVAMPLSSYADTKKLEEAHRRAEEYRQARKAKLDAVRTVN